MDKSMIKGIAVGGLAMVVLGASGVTGYKTLMQPKEAEVVAVKEVMETVVTPREQCENVQVQRPPSVQDAELSAAAAIGRAWLAAMLGSTDRQACGNAVATWRALLQAVMPVTRCKRTCSRKTRSRRWSNAAGP
ncbi:hypothetical protein [Hydrogenophaga sp.]|uniref:hypothetical protein n=1 Tax=Hydrogenophaga sp. TaxID=1904254 RepID=UPI003D2A198E